MPREEAEIKSQDKSGPIMVFEQLSDGVPTACSTIEEVRRVLFSAVPHPHLLLCVAGAKIGSMLRPKSTTHIRTLDQTRPGGGLWC